MSDGRRIPDIYGQTLGEACIRLKADSVVEYRIKTTSPPREADEKYDDTYRIVRFRIDDKGVLEITVCKPL